MTAPTPMLLWCPDCGRRHIDEGDFAMKPHHTHSCQGCGMSWRPAIGSTVGVLFLPGFENAEPDTVAKLAALAGAVRRFQLNIEDRCLCGGCAECAMWSRLDDVLTIAEASHG